MAQGRLETIAVLALCLTVVSPGDAQGPGLSLDWAKLREGQPVELRTDTRQVNGWLLSLGASSLVVSIACADPARDRCTDAVVALEFKDVISGRYKKGTKAGRGFLVGGGVGVVFGAIVGLMVGPLEDLSTSGVALRTSAGFGLVGALVGSVFGATKADWREIPPVGVP